jgi:hypothetical protein
VNGGLLLDIIISKGTTILKLLANEQWDPPGGCWSCCEIILPAKGALIQALVAYFV